MKTTLLEILLLLGGFLGGAIRAWLGRQIMTAIWAILGPILKKMLVQTKEDMHMYSYFLAEAAHKRRIRSKK